MNEPPLLATTIFFHPKKSEILNIMTITVTLCHLYLRRGERQLYLLHTCRRAVLAPAPGSLCKSHIYHKKGQSLSRGYSLKTTILEAPSHKWGAGNQG